MIAAKRRLQGDEGLNQGGTGRHFRRKSRTRVRAHRSIAVGEHSSAGLRAWLSTWSSSGLRAIMTSRTKEKQQRPPLSRSHPCSLILSQ
eukprot:4235566-Pyramimonas_sp.AAC.1